MTRTDRAFQWVQVVSVVAIALMAIWVAVFDRPPLKYPVQPFPVLSKKVYPGDAVITQVRRISTEAEETSYPVARWLVNAETGERFVLRPTQTSAPPGDHTVMNSNLVVPLDFLAEHEPGMYYGAGNVTADGAVRTFHVQWRTEEFEIIRPGDNR